MTFLLIFACIALLVWLIVKWHFNAFIAFLLVSILAAFAFGLPPHKVIGSIQKGIGDTLGGLVAIITLGAMLGKIVAESGAAKQIARSMMVVFGPSNIKWALMTTGFIIGIPLFYGVGFVLMVPLIFSIALQYKLPAVQTGIPLLAALSVAHGFLPPHPSATALAVQLNAQMGVTLIYGLLAAVPAIVLAGPIFAGTIKNISAQPLPAFLPKEMAEEKMPGAGTSFFTALLPVFLLIVTTGLPFLFTSENTWLPFLADPVLVMLVSLLVAVYTLGIRQGSSLKTIMGMFAESVKDVGMILLIIGGAGALKQVFTDSGVSTQIAAALESWSMHPLVLGWFIAAIIRVCVGSATIAGLTTAGIIAPLVQQGGVNPNLMVLSVGAGSLMFSHVNDPGFWMFKEYFNLSIKETIRTWSVMETIVSVVGLGAVLLLDLFI